MVGISVLQRHAEQHPGDGANYTIIAFPYLFYTFFNVSWGVGSWTYASEIFPLSMRAKGNALCTGSLWAACFIVAQASPPIADAVGWGLYLIYSAICVAAFIFVRYALGKFPGFFPHEACFSGGTAIELLLIRYIVETRGRSLEEMSGLFGVEGRRRQDRGGADAAKGDNEADTEPLLS